MEGGCCWDLAKRIQPIALPLALSLVTCALAYIYNQLTVAGLLLASCWTYRSSGRRFLLWKWLKSRKLVPGTKKLSRKTEWKLQSPSVSLLEGSPSPLPLNMGTYMGKQEFPGRGEVCGPRAIKEKLSRPNPSVPTPTRRLSFRDPLSSSQRTYLCARRDYPLKQEIYNKPGSLPRVCLDGQQQQKMQLTPRHFTRRTPVKISPQGLKTKFHFDTAPEPNILSPSRLDLEKVPYLPSVRHHIDLETSVTHSHHLSEPEQYPTSPSRSKADTSVATFSSHHKEDPCATESVLKALRECLKRKRIKDDDSEDTENKRRKEHGEESKLVVNGSFCGSSKMEASRASWRSQSSSMENLSQQSSISIQDILREVPSSKNSDGKLSPASSSSLENLSKRKIITVPGHNEITSSLSSSRYHLQKKKRSMDTPRCETPDWPIKKMRKDRLETSMSPSQETMKTQISEAQRVEANPSPVQLHKPRGNLPWKRHVHLICPEHPDEFYRLPPGPIPGYSVTQADYDAAKEAAQQRFLKLFQEPSAPSVPSAPETRVSLTSQTSNLPDKSFPAGNDKPNTSAANTTFTLFSSTSDAKSVTASSTTPLLFSTVTTSGTSSLQSLGSGQTKSESQYPKNGLFQVLGKPEGSNNNQPMFNPVFGPSESVNPSPVTAAPGLSTTTATTLKPICEDPRSQQAQTSMFKPIFEAPSSQTAPSALTSPFVFSSSTSTTSSSFLGTTGNSTVTGKQEKPNLAVTTCTSNAISSSSVPTFGITKADPVSQGGPTSQANTNFGFIGSTSVPAISTAFGSTTSAFTATVGSTANNTFPRNTAPTGASSISGSEAQTSISTTNSFPKFGVSVGQNVFSASNPFGSGTQSTTGTSIQSATNANFSFVGSTSASTQPTFGFSHNTSMPFGSGTKSSNTSNSSGFSAVGSVFGSATVPPSSIVTPNKSSSIILGTPEKCETKNQLVTNQIPLGQGLTPAPFQSIMPTQSFTSSSTPFAPSTPTANQSSTPSSFPSMTAGQNFTSPGNNLSPAAGFFSHGTAPKTRTAVRHKLHPRRPHPRKK
ncbi:hypothetical protein XENTR_v10005216 [Xenopus tropicalis]|uniref:Nuclear envelope pore membrane protein POM 121 n=2 Tax=Xenopus tropicalis TaxID=8364 RepID=F6SWK0_XENTR|nr:nuclear envelope pore membrane protein POM 121 [Xenopus tropicalis]KAE8622371.1 hypothetical protein XENTR_v10005216 [Xenopus tropicalis]|eukprot:NP_001120505.2 nuclear envelope pore membrane protein POM 121 [Xenopus tropicalis]